MNQNYEPEFKKKIVRLHLEEGRSLKGLAAEYGVSKASISIWTKQFREECQTSEEAKADYDYMKENLQLKRQLAELQKENEFLKKAAAFFAKEIDQRLIDSFRNTTRNLDLDGYSGNLISVQMLIITILKIEKLIIINRKMKSKTLFEKSITLIYRTVHAYLIRKGYDISSLTVHKYMNTEMQLFSISRKKKPEYEHGVAHKVYENKLNQDFHANAINLKWCTDFTYLFLTDGSKRYNCTIVDLHDRSVISSITDKNITADLAKRTLEKAIHSQPGIDLSKLLLHSDQGSQYTSKEFTEFCEKLGITQSMSKAGYPYDNAPMERYFTH